MAVLVGTAGWRHDSWRGTFYPEHLSEHPDLWLRHYAERFPTVELPVPLNLDGYRREARALADTVRDLRPFDLVPALPPEWGARALAGTPPEAREAAERACVEVARPLKDLDRLGVLLVTVPEGVRHAARTEAALEAAVYTLFESDIPCAVEFLDRSWLEPVEGERGEVVGYGDLAPTVSETLLEANAALVVADGPGWPTRERVDTATHAYVRFLGRNFDVWDLPGSEEPDAYDTAPVETLQALGVRANRDDYRYTADELREWVPFIHDLDKAAGYVRVAFANSPGANAARNALELMDLLGGRAVRPALRARA